MRNSRRLLTVRDRHIPRSALRDVLRLILRAFRMEFLWDSGQLIGLPTYQGLLEGLNPYDSIIPWREVLPTAVKPVRPEANLFDGAPRMAEPELKLLSVVDGDFLDRLAVREMSERYRLASGRSRLHSKVGQN